MNQANSYTSQFITPIRAVMFSHQKLMQEAERQFGPFEEGGYHPGVRIPVDVLSELLQFLYEQTGFRDLALKSGAHVELNQFGAVNYYLMACSTLEEIFESLATVHELLITPEEKMWVEAKQDDLSIALTSTRISGLGDMLRYEQLLSTLSYLFSYIAGSDCRPIRVDMPLGQPDEHAIHQTWFGCEVQYNQPYFKLIYSSRWRHQLLPNANRAMKEVLQGEITRYLKQRQSPDTLVQKVFDILNKLDNLGGINQVNIASQLNMSESTLKRRLSEEDASFKTLYTRYRQQRTLEFLSQDCQDFEELALTLGFSERASFERAFKNWYGVTPARFRNLSRLCTLSKTSIDLSQADDLPSAPGVCREVIQVLNDPDYEIEDLLEILNKDPVLSGKLLGLANSAFFGSKKVESLENAVVRVLGSQTVLNLAIALLASSELVNEELKQLDMPRFWYQALGTAWLSSELAALVGEKTLGQNPNQAYLTGLLANLGLLLLAYLRPQDVDQLMPVLQSSESIKENAEFEKRVLGINRYEGTSVLLTHWNLPGYLISNINDLVLRVEQPKMTQDIATVVAVSLNLMHDPSFDQTQDLEIALQHLAPNLSADRVEYFVEKTIAKMPLLKDLSTQLFSKS